MKNEVHIFRFFYLTSNIKRLFAVLCAVFLTFILFSVGAAAAEPTYKVTDAYRGSKYYNALLKVELTGNFHTDLVNIAKSQVSYHEGNALFDFDGSSAGFTNSGKEKSYTEYGYWFGVEAMREAKSVDGWNYEWCAMFVSWCAAQARIPVTTLGPAAYATTNGSANSGGYIYFHLDYKPKELYEPKAGDLIFFNNKTGVTWNGQGYHVGIVTGVKNNKVHTVEGNASGECVREMSYALSNTAIAGYGYFSMPTLTVNYLANSLGDEVRSLPEKLIFEQGNVASVSDVIPERDGYLFCGWSKSAKAEFFTLRGGDTIDTKAKVTRLYAVWEPLGTLESGEWVCSVLPPEAEYKGKVIESAHFYRTMDGDEYSEWTQVKPEAGDYVIESALMYRLTENKGVADSERAAKAAFIIALVAILVLGCVAAVRYYIYKRVR